MLLYTNIILQQRLAEALKACAGCIYRTWKQTHLPLWIIFLYILYICSQIHLTPPGFQWKNKAKIAIQAIIHLRTHPLSGIHKFIYAVMMGQRAYWLTDSHSQHLPALLPAFGSCKCFLKPRLYVKLFPFLFLFYSLLSVNQIFCSADSWCAHVCDWSYAANYCSFYVNMLW